MEVSGTTGLQLVSVGTAERATMPQLQVLSLLLLSAPASASAGGRNQQWWLKESVNTTAPCLLRVLASSSKHCATISITARDEEGEKKRDEGERGGKEER